MMPLIVVMALSIIAEIIGHAVEITCDMTVIAAWMMFRTCGQTVSMTFLIMPITFCMIAWICGIFSAIDAAICSMTGWTVANTSFTVGITLLTTKSTTIASAVWITGITAAKIEPSIVIIGWITPYMVVKSTPRLVPATVSVSATCPNVSLKMPLI